MKRRIALLLACCLALVSGAGYALETDEALFAQCCDILSWRPPEGWMLEGFERADLNGDGVTDLVTLLRRADGASRMLAVIASGEEPYLSTYPFVPNAQALSTSWDAFTRRNPSPERTRCEACGGRFDTAEAFAGHVCVVYPEADKVFCDVCGKWFDEGETFREHACQPRDGQRTYCGVCGGWFAPEHACALTPAPAAPAAERVACTVCGGVFDAGEAFGMHVCVSRPQNDGIYCDLCQQYFQEGAAFREHICQ